MSMNAVRFIVDDAYQIRGRSLLLSGILELGVVKVGDKLSFVGTQGRFPLTVVAIEKFQQKGLSKVAASSEDLAPEVEGIEHNQVKCKDLIINA